MNETERKWQYAFDPNYKGIIAEAMAEEERKRRENLLKRRIAQDEPKDDIQ